MIRKLSAALFILSLLIATPMWGDVTPRSLGLTHDVPTGHGCKKVTLCNGQTTTGACDDAGDGTGDEIVLQLGGHWAVTLYGTQSTGAYTCTLQTNDAGHDALAGESTPVHDTALSDTNQSIPLSGLLDYIWMDCSAITTSVTVTALACPLGR